VAIDAVHRASIFEKLRPILGDEDANVLMSEFPSVEAHELVTKDFLRAELALTRGELREELTLAKGELREEIGVLREEVHREIGGLREEVHREIGGLREEVHREIGGLRVGLGEVRTEIAELEARLTVRLGGAIAAGVALLAALDLVR
jgi:hypothetical protein